LQEVFERAARLDADELEVWLDLRRLWRGFRTAEQLAEPPVRRDLDDEDSLAAAKSEKRESSGRHRLSDPALARDEKQATIEDRVKLHRADATRRVSKSQFERRRGR
jgi:hypothetical protein